MGGKYAAQKDNGRVTLPMNPPVLGLEGDQWFPVGADHHAPLRRYRKPAM